MKGLLKYLSPLAPDQSGAASVLYDMGAITVVCDAGGCTGNICGFDEPRWNDRPGKIFSAGLRDMDAILGRDDKLVEKLASAADRAEAAFAAIVGTPVPAVIGTDFRALARMAEKKCGMPAIFVECTGTRLYDRGESDTYMALLKKFAGADASGAGSATADRPAGAGAAAGKKTAGLIGMTPLDISLTDGMKYISENGLYSDYDELLPYGMGAGLEALRRAGSVTENIVVSPTGLKAARWLEEKFGTPYRVDYPFISDDLREKLSRIHEGRVLVIHQQAAADAARRIIEGSGDSDVSCASWFGLDSELAREGDFHLETEEEFADVCLSGSYDTMVCDPEFIRAAKMIGFKGDFVEFRHFAVSGLLDGD